MEKKKRRTKWDKRKIGLFIGGVLLVLFAAYLVVRLYVAEHTSLVITAQEVDGRWLTVKAGAHEDLVYYRGADLTQQESDGAVLTYYSRGEWVALDWMGYVYIQDLGEYASTWHVPEGFILEHPLWRWNDQWSIDFLWSVDNGEFPPGAEPGTSSK